MEGRSTGKRSSERPCQKTLDWMIHKVNEKKTYGHLKEKLSGEKSGYNDAQNMHLCRQLKQQ